MSDPAGRLHGWLLRRSASSEGRRVRSAGLLQAASTALGLDVVEARDAFRELRANAKVAYSPDLHGLPYAGFTKVNVDAIPETAAQTAWREILGSDRIEDALRHALGPIGNIFSDMDREDMERLIDGLQRVPGAARQSPSAFGFNLSARHLLGSSKILDRLPETVRRTLGVAHLASTPRYVVVAGPPDPQAVLLVENTTTYEEAILNGLSHRVAVIAAYGYGLNMMSDSVAGWALVESLGHGRCEVLHRTGQDHQLSKLLQHSNIYFWGDLDREGLRIALALRAKIPQLALSAFYQPMCEMVVDRAQSHPYSQICGKSNQQPWRATGDVILDRLAALCSTRAVDQEAVDLSRHSDLCLRGLL